MEGKERLPIWRDANRLLLEIEQAVRQFPRYHKYALGTDLRRQEALGNIGCSVSKVTVRQQGYLKRGLRRRAVEVITIPPFSQTGVRLCERSS